MEVYIDDMLVKSKKAESDISDLEETFRIFQRFGQKPNPAKYGVRSGKFLGYVVTEKGIKVNQEKVRAILEMPPIRIEGIHVLTGRLVGLSRFISRSVEKSFHFFKILRKGTRFTLTEEAQWVFE